MRTAKNLQKYKQQMRKRPTRAERVFAERLRSARFEFKAQCIVGFYIVDFVIPSRMLVIEVDGPSHVGREAYDLERDAFLKACGFGVVHIDNRDVAAVDFGFVRRRDEHYDDRAFRRALALGNVRRGEAIRASRRDIGRLNGTAIGQSTMHG